MSSKLLKLLSMLTAICLISIATPFASATEEVHFVFHKIDLDPQIVELRKADGSTANAEFVGQLFLLPDGRANGGFGLWERGTPDGLSLYHVISGRELNRPTPFFEFQAKRLSPASEHEITVRLQPIPAEPPVGSVTFVVTIDERLPLSFEAHGRVRAHRPIASVTDLIIDDFNYINAPPQTVVVETRGGSFTAVFENVALVFPNGEAFGFASLSTSGRGAPIFIRYTGGKLNFDEEEFDWGLMHGQTTRPGRSQPLPVLMVLADQQSASEPCRIYDIAGWEPGRLHFEAETEVTRFTLEER